MLTTNLLLSFRCNLILNRRWVDSIEDDFLHCSCTSDSRVAIIIIICHVTPIALRIILLSLFICNLLDKFKRYEFTYFRIDDFELKLPPGMKFKDDGEDDEEDDQEDDKYNADNQTSVAKVKHHHNLLIVSI